MKINGGRPGDEFRITVPPHQAASAWFIAISPDEALVTRHLHEVLELPDETPVVANWHGQYRTDAFNTTVGELRPKAAEWYQKHPTPRPPKKTAPADGPLESLTIEELERRLADL